MATREPGITYPFQPLFPQVSGHVANALLLVAGLFQPQSTTSQARSKSRRRTKVEGPSECGESYRDKIRLYLVPAIGHERVQILSPSRLSIVWRDLQAHGGRSGAPLSRRTVEFTRAVLRKSLEDAVIERIIQVNPVVGSKMAKRDGKPKHTTWTGAQVQVFLDAVAGSRWSPLWEVATGTGMRRGELCGLTWEHVDLETGIVAVERKERLTWGAAYEDTEGLVFTWENGQPIMPDYVTKQIGKEQAGLDLPKLKVHELRRSHATILLRARLPVHIVSKRLGHKDPSVTLNTYADVIPDDDTSAVDVFTKVVWGA